MLDKPVDKPYRPLEFYEFREVQNNFFLRFLDQPLNYHRYEIPDVCDAARRYRNGQSLTFQLNPSIIILQREDPNLERRLTELITRGDIGDCRAEAVAESMPDLYQAYLILRRYVEGNEGAKFCFSINYPHSK